MFWLLLSLAIEPVWVARVFFVWVSVFNLFAVAVFWSFMADLFDSAQGKRLFGFIGAGGTAGALLGPAITIVLAVPLGPANLLLVAIVFLELALFCVWRLERSAGAPQGPRRDERAIGGSAFAALPELVRSPYLLGIAALGRACCRSARRSSTSRRRSSSPRRCPDAAEQTRLFASIDLAVGVLTLATQVFATGKLIERFGTAVAAGALPAVYIVGFAALALSPTLAVVLVFQVMQRWANFALANPARQVFFTVVGREEKYKAKNLIDVVVYRGVGRVVGLAVRQPAGARHEARRDRALRRAGRRRLAVSLGPARPGARASCGNARVGASSCGARPKAATTAWREATGQRVSRLPGSGKESKETS